MGIDVEDKGVFRLNPFYVFLKMTGGGPSLGSQRRSPQDDEEQSQIDGFLRLDPDEAFLRMTIGR